MIHVNFHEPGSETGERIASKQRSAFNHVAFETTDIAATRERLDRFGAEYRVVERPDIELTQIFVRDPNNVAIELNING